MKTRRMTESWKYLLMLVLLCLCSMPQLASAVLRVPTGPTTLGKNTPSVLDATVPDYYTTANWANSPPLAKFVDTLPGLHPGNTNTLGQYLPVAVPDMASYPGSDYYIIALRQYTKKMHSDLQPTTLRGYVQLNEAGAEVAPINYLGPIIVAKRDRPVRIKFINQLPITDPLNPLDGKLSYRSTPPSWVPARVRPMPPGQPCDNTPLVQFLRQLHPEPRRHPPARRPHPLDQ